MPMEAMSYTLTITQEADYLHALVTGTNSKENVAAYLEELRRECYARNSFRVLIEERLEGPRLRTMEVYQIVSEGGLSQVRIDAMAYVDVNAEGDLMKFAETLAVNRGLPVRLFSSVANARKWLSEEDN
jgi:urocanate hydratase